MLMYSVVPEPRRCFFMWIIMKKIIIALAAMVLCVGAYAQNMKFIEASELNLIGKLMDTPNPYHRVDTVKYKGFTHGENIQVRCPAGLAVLFKTNSTVISVKSEFGWNTMLSIQCRWRTEAMIFISRTGTVNGFGPVLLHRGTGQRMLSLYVRT